MSLYRYTTSYVYNVTVKLVLLTISVKIVDTSTILDKQKSLDSGESENHIFLSL
ncbi:MAG: hypothetical protein ACXABK_00760 [Candidatus Heimdallarchaeaceae archaeon]